MPLLTAALGILVNILGESNRLSRDGCGSTTFRGIPACGERETELERGSSTSPKAESKRRPGLPHASGSAQWLPGIAHVGWRLSLATWRPNGDPSYPVLATWQPTNDPLATELGTGIWVTFRHCSLHTGHRTGRWQPATWRTGAQSLIVDADGRSSPHHALCVSCSSTNHSNSELWSQRATESWETCGGSAHSVTGRSS